VNTNFENGKITFPVLYEAFLLQNYPGLVRGRRVKIRKSTRTHTTNQHQHPESRFRIKLKFPSVSPFSAHTHRHIYIFLLIFKFHFHPLSISAKRQSYCSFSRKCLKFLASDVKSSLFSLSPLPVHVNSWLFRKGPNKKDHPHSAARDTIIRF